MGLDAVVFCDCVEKKRLRIPHPYPRLLYVRSNGSPDIRSKNLAKLEKHDEWMELPPCKHDSMMVGGSCLGNIGLVDHVSSVLLAVLRPPLPTCPVLLGKVLYDGGHTVRNLVKWFDYVFDENRFAEQLSAQIIRTYKPIYDKHRARNKSLLRQQKQEQRLFDRSIVAHRAATLKHWTKAVGDAKNLFHKQEFISKCKEYDEAVCKIKEYLNYPDFNFDYGQWHAFLNILQFGNLRPLHRSKRQLITKMKEVGAAFRILVDDSRKIEARMQAVLSGPAKVKGIGLNVITKILTAHDGKSWPVYNQRVQGVLEKYGYGIPRGAGKAEKYLAFAKLMQRFVRETGARDMYALDRFFLDSSRSKRD